MKTWFHGSPVKQIKSFVIDKPRYDSLEGSGVYLTQSYAVARGYAGSEGSVYELEVSGAILDLTTMDELNHMVKMASKIAGVNVRKLEYTEDTLKEITQGRYQIGSHKGMGIGWQIKNILLNNEAYISKPGSEEKALAVETKINEYLNEHDAWLYEDTKLGRVMVVKNPSKVVLLKEIEVGSEEDENNL